MSNRPTIQSLSERNFTIAARILTDAGVTVGICENPAHPACAWWEHETKRVFLNDAHPKTDDPIKNLIFNRGKLYHELAHKLFTNAYDYRNELSAKAKDPALFDRIRQTLEDGYIEQRIAKQWDGATPYIRSLLLHCLESDTSEHGALALFVRLFVWRDAAAKKAWGQWETLIKKAVHSDSKGVCDAAFEIAEALAKGGQKQPPQEPNEPQGDGKGNPEPKGKGKGDEESNDPQSGEGEGEQNGEASNEAPEGDSGAAGEGEGDDTGESTESDSEGNSGGGNGSGEQSDKGSESAGGDSGSGEEIEAEVAEDIQALVEALVEEALREAEAEAEAEYNEIMEEIAQYAAEQEYATPDEEHTAERIAEVLRSTLVESNRQKWVEVRRCGSFNSRRIVNAITGGTCLKQRQETESLPHIALLLDNSGSMAGAKLHQLSIAGRAINGAIAQVTRKAMVASFETFTRVLETVPVQGLSCLGGTDTAHAIDTAWKWLDQEEAQKGLIIVCTDGHPDDEDETRAAFNKAKERGYFVLCVWIGGFKPHTQDPYYHASLTCKDISKLPEALTEPLQMFVAGTF